jgi:hypothetical protein
MGCTPSSNKSKIIVVSQIFKFDHDEIIIPIKIYASELICQTNYCTNQIDLPITNTTRCCICLNL